MEVKTIMNQLGFIIAPNGKKFAFGEYKPYQSRNEDNPHYFHDSAFKIEVVNTPEWKQLELPNIETDIKKEINFLTQLGLIVALNATYEICEICVPTILLATPETMTDDQIKVLLEKKEELLIFDKGKRFIYIINKDGNSIDTPETIQSFYEKYVESKQVEQSPKR